MNYNEAYEQMSEASKEAMHDLYMSGINHDGHSWNTYADITEAVAAVYSEARKQAFTEVLERIDEGFCFTCPHNTEECFKVCHKEGWEHEELLKWLKEIADGVIQ